MHFPCTHLEKQLLASATAYVQHRTKKAWHLLMSATSRSNWPRASIGTFKIVTLTRDSDLTSATGLKAVSCELAHAFLWTPLAPPSRRATSVYAQAATACRDESRAARRLRRPQDHRRRGPHVRLGRRGDDCVAWRRGPSPVVPRAASGTKLRRGRLEGRPEPRCHRQGRSSRPPTSLLPGL